MYKYILIVMTGWLIVCFTYPLVENIFLKLNAALTYVAITYRKINESSLCNIKAPFRTFKNRCISLDDVKFPAIASNMRAIRRTHLENSNDQKVNYFERKDKRIK